MGWGEVCMFIVNPRMDSTLGTNSISTDPDAQRRGRRNKIHLPHYLSEWKPPCHTKHASDKFLCLSVVNPSNFNFQIQTKHPQRIAGNFPFPTVTNALLLHPASSTLPKCALPRVSSSIAFCLEMQASIQGWRLINTWMGGGSFMRACCLVFQVAQIDTEFLQP